MISCQADIDNNLALHAEPLERMESVLQGNKNSLLLAQEVHIQTCLHEILIGFQNRLGARSHNLLGLTFMTDIVPAPPLVNRVLSLIRMLKLRDKHGMGMTFVFQTKSLVRFYALLIIMQKSNRLIRQRLKHYLAF